MGAKLAGGGGKGKGMQPNSEPNVIPFIDIMLVLLIIFMVASPPPTVDIKVDMPPPAPPLKVVTQDRPTIIVLRQNPATEEVTYSIGDVPVTIDTLGARLVEIASANNPSMTGNLQKLFLEGKIFVRADQETAYSNVIELMSEIDEAGFKSVSLVAETAADGT